VNPWEAVLATVRPSIDEESYRRWFSLTSYAGDSGDQISVWVPSESARRHIEVHYLDLIEQALIEIQRADTHVRFIVTGFDEDEEDTDRSA
jgi:chromosomal replication initiation ATPase DnaA